MQVAVAPPSNGNCSDAIYTYVGPKGIQGASPSAYFMPVGDSISGGVPFGTFDSYVNPARCFRYKVFFETNNIEESPLLSDFELNYSP